MRVPPPPPPPYPLSPAHRPPGLPQQRPECVCFIHSEHSYTSLPLLSFSFTCFLLVRPGCPLLVSGTLICQSIVFIHMNPVHPWRSVAAPIHSLSCQRVCWPLLRALHCTALRAAAGCRLSVRKWERVGYCLAGKRRPACPQPGFALRPRPSQKVNFLDTILLFEIEWSYLDVKKQTLTVPGSKKN